jgi:hypothetical protein
MVWRNEEQECYIYISGGVLRVPVEVDHGAASVVREEAR